MMVKIMVLEDDLPSLKLMRDVLEMQNYQVIEATDGLKALQIAEQEKPILAILDVMLPTLNGFQVCERLRKISDLKYIPIIILTVLNENQHRIRAIEAGANDFLSKPFNRIELLTKIKSLLAVQEEMKDLVPFDSMVHCLITGLGRRDPAAKARGLRVGYIAERIALTRGTPAREIEQMKRGAYLQDIGLLCLPADAFVENNPQDDIQAQLGEVLMDSFDVPVIKNIVRYHHCNLKSPQYPAHLPEDLRQLINIVALARRFDQLNFGGQTARLPDAVSILEAEMRQGCWPEDLFLILKCLVSTGNFIEYL